jgi:hypothetical protein
VQDGVGDPVDLRQEGLGHDRDAHVPTVAGMRSLVPTTT